MSTEFNSIDLSEAVAAQEDAANDSSKLVQLIAGPGTGKSFSIEKRVIFLLQNGIKPSAIYPISYTRAAATDLQIRIQGYCHSKGFEKGVNIRAYTLHALALKILRKSGFLNNMYPADPFILDEWEVENIFDAEFADKFNVKNKRRVTDIRAYYEAYWNTGCHMASSYTAASQPITEKEQNDFAQFKMRRAYLYSCILPGEIIQLVVERCRSGTLDATSILDITHLIVDEYQDLNPMDINFIDYLIEKGVNVFACGDDDQSIYSFRHGSTNTIRDLQKKYQCGSHILNHCFRCTPNVLKTAQDLITSYADQNRIRKNYISMYDKSNPPIKGSCYRWKFSTYIIESQAIAASCSSLISSGFPPRDILILISSQNGLLPKIKEALRDRKLEYESPDDKSFLDSSEGRWIFSLIRLACNKDDYVALRTFWGETPRVGIKSITALADWIISFNLDFKDVFFNQSIPLTGLKNTITKLIKRLQAIIAILSTWNSVDTYSLRNNHIDNIISDFLGDKATTYLKNIINSLPSEITLSELRDYLWTTNDDQKIRIVNMIYERLGLPILQNNVLPSKIRIMTMHGSKGLSAKIVFIPGLEEEILPGKHRKTSGHVQEAARLLYVAITRAKIACVLSYTKMRFINGKMTRHVASQFTCNLGGVFISRTSGFTPQEVARLISDGENL